MIFSFCALGDHPSACSLHVRPQVGFSCGAEHSQGARCATGRLPLLSLRKKRHLRLRLELLCAGLCDSR